mmetsp:Transcript_40518/g.115688  ORF Transcript_40518/g.115688 Transcript_40518/m.115688 type:complete len:214 (-) Transcript_40518:50-691(-)
MARALLALALARCAAAGAQLRASGDGAAEQPHLSDIAHQFKEATQAFGDPSDPSSVWNTAGQQIKDQMKGAAKRVMDDAVEEVAQFKRVSEDYNSHHQEEKRRRHAKEKLRQGFETDKQEAMHDHKIEQWSAKNQDTQTHKSLRRQEHQEYMSTVKAGYHESEEKEFKARDAAKRAHQEDHDRRQAEKNRLRDEALGERLLRTQNRQVVGRRE